MVDAILMHWSESHFMLFNFQTEGLNVQTNMVQQQIKQAFIWWLTKLFQAKITATAAKTISSRFQLTGIVKEEILSLVNFNDLSYIFNPLTTNVPII